MNIAITEIDAQDLPDANQCNEPFDVNSRLLLATDDGVIHYRVVPVTLYQKRYPPNEIDYAAYIDRPDQTVFFARVDGELAGELVLRRWWNNFAYVEDIAVKAAFRRRGVARELMARAMDWAKAHTLPGLMLETQNDNVAACLFYQQCGFEIGGFDRNLYRAIRPNSEEIALYWYLLFPA